jgi:hypothetical protein
MFALADHDFHSLYDITEQFCGMVFLSSLSLLTFSCTILGDLNHFSLIE